VKRAEPQRAEPQRSTGLPEDKNFIPRINQSEGDEKW
jgi:hypothetical protein